jgi:hypothetical protein
VGFRPGAASASAGEVHPPGGQWHVMHDVWFVVLTVVLFAVLALAVRAVEKL